MVGLLTWTRGMLVLAVLCGAFVVRAPTASAVPLAPPPEPAAFAASGTIQSAVCTIAGYGVVKGAKRLMRYVTEHRIATLSVSLFVGIGKWQCKKWNKLGDIIDEIVDRDDSWRSRLGPMVFDVYATETYYDATWEQVKIHWTSSDPLGRGRTIYLWQRADGEAWQPIDTDRLVRHGWGIQFAVRVVNSAGVTSPWSYSPHYQID